MSIHKGDQYDVPVKVTYGKNHTIVTPDNVDEMTIKIGSVSKSFPDGDLTFDSETKSFPDGDLTFDSENGRWLYPITAEETDLLNAGDVSFQVRIRIADDIIHSDIKYINISGSIIKITE